MTLEQFSDQFDTLVSSYMRFRAFDEKEPRDTIEFDEYEKSVFLTQAQEAEVISLYTGKNTFGDSFERTEETRRYLSNLIAEDKENPIQNSSNTILGLETTSRFFTLPEDLWYITYEAVKLGDDAGCKSGTVMEVVPARQDEYHKLRKNPFRGATKRRALRFDLADGVIEVVCKYSIDYYYVRYLRKPNPIVLVPLPNGLEIEGCSEPTPCELHEALHKKILERAVMMALQTKGYNINKNNNKEN